MSNICKTCNHSKRLEIDREIVKGVSHSVIARKYDLTSENIRYHSMNHLTRQLVKSAEMQQAVASAGMVGEMEDLLNRSKNILNQAEKKGQLNTALNAIRETRGTIELMARVAATLHQLRAAELQLKERAHLDGDYEPLDPNALDRLNDGELLMLIAIHEKLYGERSKNEDVVISVLKELKRMHDPSLPCPPSAYYGLHMEGKRRKRTRTKFKSPKNYVDPPFDQDAALAEERELARREKMETPPERAPIEEQQEEPIPLAGTWKGEDPFKRATVPGSVRTSNLALKSLLDG